MILRMSRAHQTEPVLAEKALETASEVEFGNVQTMPLAHSHWIALDLPFSLAVNDSFSERLPKGSRTGSKKLLNSNTPS